MKEKADSDLVRRQNRRIVLEALRQNRRLARIELGRLTGLSPASITAISAQLIEENVIEELDHLFPLRGNTKRGRPIVGLALRKDAAHVVVVKISIDGIELGLADFRGQTVAGKFLNIPTFGADKIGFGKRVAEEIRGFANESGFKTNQIARIGIAVQGLADTRDGSIAWSPAFRARNIQVCAPIEAALGVPCTIANDANMIAEGLAASDSNRYGGVTAAIFTDYGVGMGLIINGRVFHGATGAASEFGHMNHIPNGAMCRCGRRGCIEAVAADYGILRTAEGGDDESLPLPSAIPNEKMAEIVQKARTGHATALRAFEKAGEALGYGLARMIAIVNPERVVIAGPGINEAQFTEPAMRRALANGLVDELRRDVTIEYTSFSTDMIIQGTISALMHQIDSEVFAVGPMPVPKAKLESVA